MSQLKILLTRHFSTSLALHQCYRSFIFLSLSWERKECETWEIRNKMTLFRGGGNCYWLKRLFHFKTSSQLITLNSPIMGQNI